MDAQTLQCFGISGQGLKFLQHVRVGQRKRARTCPPQAAQMRTTAQVVAQLVRHGAHVSARADVDGETGFGALQCLNRKGVDSNPSRLQLYRFALAGQLVCGLSVDLFGRKLRRHLFHLAVEPCGGRLYLRERQIRGHFQPSVRAPGLSLGVIGVCRESEADVSLIALFSGGKVLREASELAHQQRQNPGGHGVQRAEVAN